MCYKTHTDRPAIRPHVLQGAGDILSQRQPADTLVAGVGGPDCTSPFDHQIVPLLVAPSKTTFVPEAKDRLHTKVLGKEEGFFVARPSGAPSGASYSGNLR